MGLKAVVIFVYLIISALLFSTFDAIFEVWISFFISNLLLLGIVLFHLFREREYAPFISIYIVFNFLFFIVAPIIQINVIGTKNALFATNLPYNTAQIILTNVLICTFHITFFCSYLLFKKWSVLRKVSVYKTSRTSIIPSVILIMGLVSIAIVILSFSFVRAEMQRANWQLSTASVSTLLIWKKVLFMIPFAALILCKQYLKNRRFTRPADLIAFIAVVLFFTVILFWFKNPLLEKRNALGPIYICLLFLTVPRLINSNAKMTFFMFFSMIVVFPLSAIFTHTTSTVKEIIVRPQLLLEEFEGEGIGEVFNTLHYDAFINIAATIDYVQDEGFMYGEQLLSAFLFFIPRSIWEGKPITTGEFIGNHLIDKHDFNFNNLSNPVVSEGYINFGVIGVILMAIGLSLVVVKLLAWIKSEDYLKKMMALYFALHLLFLLRGDFANGFSYYIGIFIGVFVLERVIETFVVGASLYQTKWKKRQYIKEA